MMTKYFHTMICTICLTCSIVSCNDYLEVDPANGIKTDNFYQNESQVDNALTGLYGTLKPLPKYLFAMSEIRSDNVWVLTDTKQNDYADVATFNANGLLTDNIVKGCWSDYFKTVATANMLLQKIDEVTFTKEEVRTQYIAEARFIRALAYFDLVRFFGRVPLTTTALTTEEAFQLGQSEASEVYEQVIVPDLQFAVNNLAEVAFDCKNGKHSERVSQTAAKALLGKVYLTMAGFPLYQESKKTQAASLFKEVIDYANTNSKYWASDMDAWNNMWIHENDNKYSIFEIQYITAADEGNPMVTISVPSNPGTDWCGNNLVTGTHLYIEKGLQMHYIELNEDGKSYKDQRTDGTMNTKETVDEEGNISTSTGNTFYVKFFESRVKRAKLGYSDMDADIIDRTYWPQNYPILRLEDVMLLYAECVGRTEEGYEMVNKIRRRAGLVEIEDLSEEEFQEAVANERRYELAEEGHRWFDLVRQNKYVETLKAMFINDDTTTSGTYAAFANRVTKDMYLYPIPQSQIEVREGLYTQNPGY